MTMVRSMQQVRPRMRFADLERMPEDGRRFELYDGESTDRGRKLRLLARSGVREYWLIDPIASVVEQFVLERDSYVLTRAAGCADKIDSRALPRLSVTVADLFVG